MTLGTKQSKEGWKEERGDEKKIKKAREIPKPHGTSHVGTTCVAHPSGAHFQFQVCYNIKFQIIEEFSRQSGTQA